MLACLIIFLTLYIRKRSNVMSNGIFGDLFDFNGNGNIDCFEQGLEFMLLNQLLTEDEDDDESDD